MATIANQNGRHMVQHVLVPINIPFHWNLFIFEFLTIFFNFYNGSHFENFKHEEHNFEWWSIFVSSYKWIRSTFPFNIFCTFDTMATAAILNFLNPTKAATHYDGYSYKVSWSLMKGIQNIFKSPLFCFHGNCSKVCPTDPDFFGLSRSTRYGCCSYQV
jgi:hypothetical protein